MIEIRSARVLVARVTESRPISVEGERRTGVQHKSTQGLIVRNGVVVWRASHLLERRCNSRRAAAANGETNAVTQTDLVNAAFTPENAGD